MYLNAGGEGGEGGQEGGPDVGGGLFEKPEGEGGEAAGDDEVVVPVVGEGEGVHDGAVEVVFGVVDGGEVEGEVPDGGEDEGGQEAE